MLKILIVDNEPNSTESLSIGIRRYGFYVETANSGQEGLQKISQTKFDFVVCDIDMPEMDGWELFTKIQERYPDITMIFMTALLRKNYKTPFNKQPLLIKPFQLQELVQLLR